LRWPLRSLPLFHLIEDLSISGARTAKKQYGARGWVAHHNTDHWRGTAQDPDHWRDTQVSVRGPAVRALEAGDAGPPALEAGCIKRG